MATEKSSLVEMKKTNGCHVCLTSKRGPYIAVGISLFLTLTVIIIAVILIEGEPTEPRARAIYALTKTPLIDGHNDLAWQYRQHVNNSVNRVHLDRDLKGEWPYSMTDIPRLNQGYVGGQFWSCYIPCSSQYKDATRMSLDQLDTILRFITRYPYTFRHITEGREIMDAFKAKRISSLIGLESGHAIDNSLATLRMFHRLGVRYMTLTHNCDTPWAQSHVNEGKPGGLTYFGKDVIREMNRIGMLVDLAHVSKNTMLDVLDITKAPVMFSHSSARALCDHSRNVPDDVLYKVAENGGIVMVNFVSEFINCPPRNQSKATLQQVADHIEHIRDIAGIHYVGIGADYDGAVGFPEGLEDVSKYPDLFTELARRGWSAYEMELLAGRNLIRVMERADLVSTDLLEDENTSAALENHIPNKEIPDRQCRTGGFKITLNNY